MESLALMLIIFSLQICHLLQVDCSGINNQDGMVNETQTWSTKALAAANSRLDMDGCWHFPGITGSRMGLRPECKITLELLAPWHRFGIFDFPIWFFQVSQEKRPADHESGRRKTLLVRVPGMAQLPARTVHDRFRRHIAEIHSYSQTSAGNSIYRHRRRIGTLQLLLLRPDLP